MAACHRTKRIAFNKRKGNRMKQPYHARLQLLMAQWIRSEGQEFGRRLSEEREKEDNVGIQISDETMLGVDCVAMHMATAACVVFEAMARAVDCPVDE